VIKDKDNKKSLKDLTESLPLQPETQTTLSDRIIKRFNDKLDIIQNSLDEKKMAILVKEQAQHLGIISNMQKEIVVWLKTNTKKLYIRLVVILVLNAIISCVLITGSWVVFKTYYFKEIPNQQKQIADMTFHGYHLQDMGNNKFLLNANNKDKPAYLLDFSKDKITHVPELRVNKNWENK